MNGAQMIGLERIRAFMLSGQAKFTLVSERTGDRKTFRVRASDNPTTYFVDLLVGPDNGPTCAGAGGAP
jgi:hypothetical protein